MTRRAARFALAACVLSSCALSSCAPRASLPVSSSSSPPPLSRSSAPFPSKSPAPKLSAPKIAASKSADALWKWTREAERETPLAGSVRITRWTGGRARISTLDVVEGTDGKFRLTYTSPWENRGRILASDGKTVWQYQPREKTLLRKPALAESLRPDSTESAGALVPQLVPGTPKIAARPTSVLILNGPDGKRRARRWVDDATGRTLRTDEYGPSGRLQKRVEMTEVEFDPAVSDDEFAASVPGAARVVTARAARATDARREARRLRLPERAGGFRLRSVLKPGAARAAATQVLYSDGARALSVFVQENVGDAALRPSARWHSVALGENRNGFAHEEDAGTSVAWIGSRNRYVAVAHAPLSDLLPVARALAEGSAPSKPGQ